MSNHRDHIRLLILQVLAQQPQYTANQEVLLSALKVQGYALSRDQLHIELAWLDNISETLVDKSSSGVHILTLTGDGLDVVDGLKTIPGIRRPLPNHNG